jgi:hypothetical protein
MNRRLRWAQNRRASDAAKQEHETLLAKTEELRDARGREVYGEAWDDPRRVM